MACLELIPKPYIYAPPFVLFGGVRIDRSFSNDSLIDDLTYLTRELNDSIEQAYNVKTLVSKHKTIIEDYLSPINNGLEQGCNDFDFRDNYRELLHSVYNKIVEQGMEMGILIGREEHPVTPLYFLKLLNDEFNAEEIKNFIGAVQITSIKLTCNALKFDSSIKGDKLMIITEVIGCSGNYYI